MRVKGAEKREKKMREIGQVENRERSGSKSCGLGTMGVERRRRQEESRRQN